MGGVPLGLSSRGSQPDPGHAESGRAPGDGRTGTGAVRGGEGEGSERRRHKMAAAPGAGPPDPCASVLLSCLQVAMATGQVLFHRFFYSKSFVKHSFEVSRAGAGERGFFFIRKWEGGRRWCQQPVFPEREWLVSGLCT